MLTLVQPTMATTKFQAMKYVLVLRRYVLQPVATRTRASWTESFKAISWHLISEELGLHAVS